MSKDKNSVDNNANVDSKEELCKANQKLLPHTFEEKSDNEKMCKCDFEDTNQGDPKGELCKANQKLLQHTFEEKSDDEKMWTCVFEDTNQGDSSSLFYCMVLTERASNTIESTNPSYTIEINYEIKKEPIKESKNLLVYDIKKSTIDLFFQKLRSTETKNVINVSTGLVSFSLNLDLILKEKKSTENSHYQSLPYTIQTSSTSKDGIKKYPKSDVDKMFKQKKDLFAGGTIDITLSMVEQLNFQYSIYGGTTKNSKLSPTIFLSDSTPGNFPTAPKTDVVHQQPPTTPQSNPDDVFKQQPLTTPQTNLNDVDKQQPPTAQKSLPDVVKQQQLPTALQEDVVRQQQPPTAQKSLPDVVKQQQLPTALQEDVVRQQQPPTAQKSLPDVVKQQQLPTALQEDVVRQQQPPTAQKSLPDVVKQQQLPTALQENVVRQQHPTGPQTNPEHVVKQQPLTTPQTNSGEFVKQQPPQTNSGEFVKQQPPQTNSGEFVKQQPPTTPQTNSEEFVKQQPSQTNPEEVAKQQPPTTPQTNSEEFVKQQPPTTPQTNTEKVVQQQPPQTNTEEVVQQQPPQTTPDEVAKQQPPQTTSEEVVQQQPPQTNTEEFVEQQPPQTNTEEVAKQEPPQTTSEEVVKQQPPQTNTEEFVKQQPPHTNTEEVVEQQPPQTNTEEVVEQQPPKTNTEEVVEQQPPQTNTEEVVKQQPPQTNYPEEVVEQQPPQTNYPEEVVKQQPPQTNYPEEVVKQQPPQTNYPEEVIEQQPPQTNYPEVIEQQPRQTNYPKEVNEQQSPQTNTEEVVKQQPPQTNTEVVIEQQPPQTNTEEVVKQQPPQTEVVEQQPPQTNTEEVVEQQPPQTNTEEFVKQQPPQTNTEEVVKQQPPQTNTEEFVKQQPPQTNTEEVVKQQPPQTNPEEVVEQQPPQTNTEEFVKQQPPQTDTEEIVKQQPPQTNPEEVVEQQPPQINPEEFVKQQPPQTNTEEVVEQQPPQTNTEEVVEQQPPQTNTEEIVKQQPPQTNTEEFAKQQPPQSNTEEIVKQQLPQTNSEEVVKQQPPTTTQTSTEEVIKQQPPQTNSEEFVMQQPPQTNTEEVVEQQPPQTNAEEFVKQQPPQTNTEEVVKQQPPQTNSEEVVKQQPPTTPQTNTEEFVKQQPSQTNPEEVAKQQPPTTPQTNSEEVVKQQPPQTNSEEVVEQQPPQTNTEEFVKQQLPQTNTEEVVKQQPPQTNSEEVVEQQPPQTNSEEVVEQHPPQTNSEEFVKQQPPLTNSEEFVEQQPPQTNPEEVAKQQPPQTNTEEVAKQQPLTTPQTNTKEVVKQQPPQTNTEEVVKQQLPQTNTEEFVKQQLPTTPQTNPEEFVKQQPPQTNTEEFVKQQPPTTPQTNTEEFVKQQPSQTNTEEVAKQQPPTTPQTNPEEVAKQQPPTAQQTNPEDVVKQRPPTTPQTNPEEVAKQQPPTAQQTNPEDVVKQRPPTSQNVLMNILSSTFSKSQGHTFVYEYWFIRIATMTVNSLKELLHRNTLSSTLSKPQEHTESLIHNEVDPQTAVMLCLQENVLASPQSILNNLPAICYPVVPNPSMSRRITYLVVCKSLSCSVIVALINVKVPNSCTVGRKKNRVRIKRQKSSSTLGSTPVSGSDSGGRDDEEDEEQGKKNPLPPPSGIESVLQPILIRIIDFICSSWKEDWNMDFRVRLRILWRVTLMSHWTLYTYLRFLKQHSQSAQAPSIEREKFPPSKPQHGQPSSHTLYRQKSTLSVSVRKQISGPRTKKGICFKAPKNLQNEHNTPPTCKKNVGAMVTGASPTAFKGRKTLESEPKLPYNPHEDTLSDAQLAKCLEMVIGYDLHTRFSECHLAFRLSLPSCFFRMAMTVNYNLLLRNKLNSILSKLQEHTESLIHDPQPNSCPVSQKRNRVCAKRQKSSSSSSNLHTAYSTTLSSTLGSTPVSGSDSGGRDDEEDEEQGKKNPFPPLPGIESVVLFILICIIDFIRFVVCLWRGRNMDFRVHLGIFKMLWRAMLISPCLSHHSTPTIAAETEPPDLPQVNPNTPFFEHSDDPPYTLEPSQNSDEDLSGSAPNPILIETDPLSSQIPLRSSAEQSELDDCGPDFMNAHTKVADKPSTTVRDFSNNIPKPLVQANTHPPDPALPSNSHREKPTFILPLLLLLVTSVGFLYCSDITHTGIGENKANQTFGAIRLVGNNWNMSSITSVNYLNWNLTQVYTKCTPVQTTTHPDRLLLFKCSRKKTCSHINRLKLRNGCYHSNATHGYRACCNNFVEIGITREEVIKTFFGRKLQLTKLDFPVAVVWMNDKLLELSPAFVCKLRPMVVPPILYSDLVIDESMRLEDHYHISTPNSSDFLAIELREDWTYTSQSEYQLSYSRDGMSDSAKKRVTDSLSHPRLSRKKRKKRVSQSTNESVMENEVDHRTKGSTRFVNKTLLSLLILFTQFVPTSSANIGSSIETCSSLFVVILIALVAAMLVAVIFVVLRFKYFLRSSPDNYPATAISITSQKNEAEPQQKVKVDFTDCEAAPLDESIEIFSDSSTGIDSLTHQTSIVSPPDISYDPADFGPTLEPTSKTKFDLHKRPNMTVNQDSALSIPFSETEDASNTTMENEPISMTTSSHTLNSTASDFNRFSSFDPPFGDRRVASGVCVGGNTNPTTVGTPHTKQEQRFNIDDVASAPGNKDSTLQCNPLQFVSGIGLVEVNSTQSTNGQPKQQTPASFDTPQLIVQSPRSCLLEICSQVVMPPVIHPLPLPTNNLADDQPRSQNIPGGDAQSSCISVQHTTDSPSVSIVPPPCVIIGNATGGASLSMHCALLVCEETNSSGQLIVAVGSSEIELCNPQNSDTIVAVSHHLGLRGNSSNCFNTLTGEHQQMGELELVPEIEDPPPENSNVIIAEYNDNTLFHGLRPRYSQAYRDHTPH
ncbi:uncharacterized protein LOC135347505 isoform X2 [Halichondria panicea]|uniref:uncharacterized protein LOC135347505 isoform X2 n=1 Tax=Halichondria panicea TaxID=6063 RepID=UPI00312BBEB2